MVNTKVPICRRMESSLRNSSSRPNRVGPTWTSDLVKRSLGRQVKVVGQLLAIGVFSPMLSGPINNAVVTATFVAVLWYAVETRRLVRGQERTAKISRHPWLEATNLKPEVIQPSHEIPLSGYHIWLPITNVGDTPAVILARFFSFWS